MDQETLINGSRSALQPLRRPGSLPSEIFTEILLLTLPPLPERQAPTLKVLSLVCRFWHIIVDSSPALWSRISIADNISHVQKAISKSGEHPIDVWGEDVIPASDSLGFNHEGGTSTFLAIVQPHAQRWQHVTLLVPPTQGSTPAPAILPSLRTLKLYSWDHSVLTDQFLALLNRQRAPFLREVSLCGLRIVRWDLILLPPTLSKLEISPVTEEYPFMVRWLSGLAACPNLAVFRISTSPPNFVARDERRLPPAVAELKALRELDLDGVHPDLITDILMRLRLPEDCAISIKCPSSVLSSLSSQINFQHAGKVIQVTIILTEKLQEVLGVCQRWHIYLNVDGPWAIRSTLDWFRKCGENSNASSSYPQTLQAGLATSNSLPVTLKLGRNWLHWHFPALRMISNLPDINRIEMDSLSGEERRALLLYLSAPQDPNRPMRTMAAFLQTLESESFEEVLGVLPFPGLSELVWRESKGNVVCRVLVEPITGQCSDGAAPGTSRRVRRWELSRPNTPWQKVV